VLLKLSISYVAARVIPLALAALAVPVYTRLLSPEEYGYYAKVMALVFLADAALFQWARMGLLRHMHLYQHGADQLRGELILASWIPGTIVISVIGILVWFLRPDSVVTVIWVLAIASIYAWQEFVAFDAIARQKPRVYSGIASTKSGLALAVGALLAILDFGADAALIGVLIGCLLAPFVFGRESWQRAILRLPKIETFKPVAAYSLPLIPTFILAWIMQLSDRLIIAYLLGNTAVGQYAVGYDLAQFGVGALLVAVNLAAYPMAVKAMDSAGPSAARDQVKKNGELLLSLAMAAAVGVTILAAPLASILVGREFQDSTAAILPMVAIAAAVAGLKAYHFDVALHLGQRTSALAYCALLGATVNIGLNFLLIPVLGIVGAAWATGGGYLVAAVASFWFGRSVFEMPPLLPIVGKACIVSMGAGIGGAAGFRLLRGAGNVLGSLSGIVLGVTFATIVAFTLNVSNMRSDWRSRIADGRP
jgi:O-antigen/teichoic acid export membrane protein